ncbi:hypothetical protein SNOG_02864 [Parastagonospora nodorum SN15]|uniref:Uncharacterized protein n=1 Tax=Phaeosphaeria nodorum (strain SN15 / ATCC MYA-4574 / FGSC 10173) TaxID=321614 RepID=Q0UZF0_PHANO|nr:hypothetical protein SNOG_02864 [Parastagonospora nodorum SN15]EAT89595.1 hypothetical protein SNOG_02864 [Parastagonospora nodorum SN15]
MAVLSLTIGRCESRIRVLKRPPFVIPEVSELNS